jgi:glycosyltransferase involved in cell wall biosynthesis
MKSLTSREVQVLYTAVDQQRFSPQGSLEALRTALGLPIDKFIVLTVRRLVFKNSVDTFVATANLLKDDPRVYFVIVGDGPDRRHIERYIQENNLSNCLLTGFVRDAALPDYYRAANLFVLPSRSGEGLGMVLLEAMASGVPVIATRAGGQVELVQEGRNGFLVDPRAPDQIADVVRTHIDKNGALESIRQQNLDLVKRQFLWDHHMSTLTASLDLVAHNGNAR